ncbi:MAG TPA: pyridoxine 5'-phosphate synthase [Chthoniobacteraceae bacterium]|jgi:pyridoxine 5-phosphate synthase|nr:pyridoxine 5'-phosphate synthase [Chthoniobacteraceae bacterium]
MQLGVNIDHVATLRQARYAGPVASPNAEPCLLAAASACERAGARGITVHLRADRRHIQDADVFRLRESIITRLNLEMGNTPEILEIALRVVPEEVCLVPENRREITTEGGLDAAGQRAALEPTIRRLQGAAIRVSLFIEPDSTQIEAARELGAEIVELHTGAFANAQGDRQEFELHRLKTAAAQAHRLGIQVNAGHGINYTNIALIRTIPHLADLNIGHSIVARSLFTGLEAAVAEMLRLMSS